MYNILIVDDEKVIRDGIENIIESSKKDQFKFYHAENGSRALQIVCSHQIDIIFSDIKMPVLNGIELLEQLWALNYMGQVVIISGYDDFKYVHSSMKLGIVDYILKPIQADQLIEQLNICIKRIFESTQTNLFYSKNKVKKESEIFYNQQEILEQFYTEQISINEFVTANHLSEYHHTVLLNISIANKEPFTEQNKLLLSQRFNMLFGKKVISDDCIFLQGLLKNNWTVLFFNKYPNKCLFIESILNQENIQYGLAQVSSISDVTFLSLFERANLSLHRNFYDFSTPQEASHKTTKPAYIDIMTGLTSSLSNLDLKGFDTHIKLFLHEVCHKKIGIESVRAHLINVIYNALSKNNNYIGVVSKYKFTEHDILHLIQDAPSCTHLYQNMIRIIKLYIDEINQRSKQAEDYIVQRVKNYVSVNYKNDAQLNEIAEKLQLHPNYLSTYFKEKTGKTFSKYLRAHRISKAKTLLKENDIKSFEIAVSVGYKDSANFYRAFKKETGLSPKEYRNSLNIDLR